MLSGDQIDAAIAENNIDLNSLFSPFEDEPRLGLAVSGGPDSLGLALLVNEWLKGRSRPQIFVYCVDHDLRPEAGAEVLRVGEIMKQLGFEFCGLKWNGEKPTTGIQAAAREARYRLIGDSMRQDDVPLLLTGHHLQDQAETVLMRVAHGSGLTGLRGMRAFSGVFGVRLARPLLKLSKPTLESIVKASGLTAIIDPSNENEDFERARWRAISPQLTKLGLTPERLGKFAERAARADEALEAQKGLAVIDADPLNIFGVAEISLSKWDAWLQEIKIRILRHSLDLCGGDCKAAELDQVELLVDALNRPVFDDQTLAGCVVRRDAHRLVIHREIGRRPIAAIQLEVGAAVHWDKRVFVSNTGDVQLRLEPACHVTRKEAENFLGASVDLPMDALASAFLVKDEAGEIVCLGLMNKCAGLMVQPAAKLPPYLANMI